MTIFERILVYFKQQYQYCIKKYKNFSQSKVEEINSIYGEVHTSRTTKRKIKVLKNFLDNINIMNSTSIIGTIEFLDQMSKYNLKFNACNFRNSGSGFSSLSGNLNFSSDFFKDFTKETYPLLYDQDHVDINTFIAENIVGLIQKTGQTQGQQPVQTQGQQQVQQQVQTQRQQPRTVKLLNQYIY